MKKILLDGKEKKIPLNKEIKIEFDESLESIIEEDNNISKIKVDKNGVTIQCDSININTNNLDEIKK